MEIGSGSHIMNNMNEWFSVQSVNQQQTKRKKKKAHTKKAIDLMTASLLSFCSNIGSFGFRDHQNYSSRDFMISCHLIKHTHNRINEVCERTRAKRRRKIKEEDTLMAVQRKNDSAQMSWKSRQRIPRTRQFRLRRRTLTLRWWCW